MFMCKINVDRSERRQKSQTETRLNEAMEPSKKKIFLEKKQVRDMSNNHELKMKQLKYKAMDTTKKQDMLNKKAAQYKTMDTGKKQDLLEKKAEQYKTMDTAKKQDLLSKKAEQYKTMDIAKKQDLLNIRKQNNTEQWMLLRSKNVLRNAKKNTLSALVRRQ